MNDFEVANTLPALSTIKLTVLPLPVSIVFPLPPIRFVILNWLAFDPLKVIDLSSVLTILFDVNTQFS